MSRVLLVEDDQLIYRLYEKLFKLEGFDFEVADNGLAGIEQIPVYQPDIILLDIMMPTMNGIEFLTKLKSDPAMSHVPVIVLTNVADMNVTNMAISKGAALCLIKSQTEPDAVVASVKGVLANSQEPQDE